MGRSLYLGCRANKGRNSCGTIPIRASPQAGHVDTEHLDELIEDRWLDWMDEIRSRRWSNRTSMRRRERDQNDLEWLCRWHDSWIEREGNEELRSLIVEIEGNEAT